MDREHLIKAMEYFGDIDTCYHIIKTGLLPSKIATYDFHEDGWDELENYIQAHCTWQEKDRIESIYLGREHHSGRDLIWHIDGQITLSMNRVKMASLLYDHESDKELLSSIKKRFCKLKKKKSRQSIGLIKAQQSNLTVQFCEYKLYDQDLIEYMDDQTKAFYHEIIQNLQSDFGKGLYLLYGEPGTGKTSFIKSVLSNIDKKALFITPSFTEDLTSPNLISLLLDYPDSVLVIEDADSVIMKRQADNSSAVSNLLNLSDGFLSDFMNMKIICTFNTNLGEIDPALLRDGRLKGMHEFKKLSPSKARSIATVLGREVQPAEPMTLAEVCNGNERTYNKPSAGIGF